MIEECEITGGPKDTGKILNETGERSIELKKNNGEEKDNRRRGGTAIRKHSEEAKSQKLP